MVTTLLGAIEDAGSPPLPLTIGEGGGVVALRLGSFFPAGVGGWAALVAGFALGAMYTSLCLGTGFGGGVRVRSRALAPSVTVANGGAEVDDDEVRSSTISVS